MALSELYEIGKRSRKPLPGLRAGLARVATDGRSPVEVLDYSDPGELKKERLGSIVVADGKGEETTATATTTDLSATSATSATSAKAIATSSTLKSARPECLICRQKESKYSCPSCNIAYCSLACYRSNQHASCSQPFLRKTLQDELGGKGSGGEVDDTERRAMMDVLRRLRTLGEDQSQDQSLDGAVDDDDGQDCEQIEQYVGEEEDLLDLENASVEQLLSLLSPEEKARFQAAVEDKDPKQSKARSLFEKLIQTNDNIDASGATAASRPWWKQDTKRPMTLQSDHFVQKAKGMASHPTQASSATLQYNIMAVLVAYVYIVRYLDVVSLQDSWAKPSDGAADQRDHCEDDQDYADMPRLEDESDNDNVDLSHSTEEKATTQELVKNLCDQLVPLLEVTGDFSKVVLESTEDVSMWFAARLDCDAALTPAKALLYLYQDVKILTRRPLFTDLASIYAESAVLALADMSDFLPQVSQRKLLFYSAYWIRLSQSQRKQIEDEIASQVQRLEAELERSEDEERFHAANEALQQNSVRFY